MIPDAFNIQNSNRFKFFIRLNVKKNVYMYCYSKPVSRSFSCQLANQGRNQSFPLKTEPQQGTEKSGFQKKAYVRNVRQSRHSVLLACRQGRRREIPRTIATLALLLRRNIQLNLTGFESVYILGTDNILDFLRTWLTSQGPAKTHIQPTNLQTTI